MSDECWIAELLAENAKLRESLQRIAEIPNEEFGADWQEIDAAREIAREALKPPK